jgi:cytidylate kinase
MSKYPVITISREYASGGSEIGKILAARLGIAYYDNELITLAAERSGYSRSLFKDADQSASNSLLFSLSTYGSSLDGNYTMPLGDNIFLIQAEIIRGVAQSGACVIVGRCGDYILRQNPDCVHVFIRAPLPWRIEYAVKNCGLAAESAREEIQPTDKRRAEYYSHFTGQKWGASSNYTLTIDSSCVGIPATAEVLYTLIRQKEAQIS